MNNTFDILIVEDEKVVNESAARILKSEGYTVDQAFDGETALARVENNRYKLVITDLMLKEISGINIIELIRKKYSHIPVIMITGYATIINVFEAFKMGAYDYIPKPFTFDELLSVVTRAIVYSGNTKSADEAYEIFANPGRGIQHSKLYLMGDHSWVYFEENGTATLGLGKTFATVLHTIRSAELLPAGDGVIQGNSFVVLEGNDNYFYRIWSPMSGIIIENNPDIAGSMDVLKSKDYMSRWFTRIKPDNMEKEIIHLTPFVGH